VRAFERALAEELSAPGVVVGDAGQARTTSDPDATTTTEGDEPRQAGDPAVTPTSPSTIAAGGTEPTTTVVPGTATTTTEAAREGPTTTTTTTTTTPPSSTTTTTTTSTTTTVPPKSGIDPRMLGTIHLGTAGRGDTASQPVLPLQIDAPPAVALPNYDTDRDDDPGLMIKKDGAGLNGSDPTKVQRFRVDVATDGTLVGDAKVRLYVAAKDFEKKTIHVATGLYRCDSGGSCSLIADGDKRVGNANRFKSVTIPMGEVDVPFVAGDRLELRVVVLDDSDDDAWFAYGTAASPAHVKLSRD
jgi:hypothetical protein